MDKHEKKRLKDKARQQQREGAIAALPLTPVDLKEMFDWLDVELPKRGCDHTRRLAQEWINRRGHDAAPIFRWLDTQGGFCDCEILANVEQQVADALKAISRNHLN